MPRIVRKNGHRAKKVYKAWNYREALPLLLEDFDNRCAYSMVHKDTLAKRQLHVDHFDPKKKKRSPYGNLFPCYDVVNEAKSNAPIVSFIDPAAHLLNPCEVDDYGHLIFENLQTGELEPHPDSAAADYHLTILDLNNANLAMMRKDRTNKKRILAAGFKPVTPEQSASLEAIKNELPILIHEIPEMPSDLRQKATAKRIV